MKTITISEAQTQLLQLASQPEPLILTEGSQPIAVLIHIHDATATPESGEKLVSVAQIEDVGVGKKVHAVLKDGVVWVLGVYEKAPSDGQPRDWWQALQQIGDGQRARGFVGTVAEIDRSDDGYDARMDEIYKRTLSKDSSG